MPDEEQSNVARTLLSYELGIQAYLEDSTPTPTPAYARFRGRVAAELPMGARMLELGSGPGHDALFFEAQAVAVRRTDGTHAFVERLRSMGYPADVVELATSDLGGPYDIVYANAVLLHLTPSQLDDLLVKAAGAVVPDGMLAFTVKEGDDWTTTKIGHPRYFTYWREAALGRHLAAAGWTPVSVEHVQGRTEPWLYVACRRTP